MFQKFNLTSEEERVIEGHLHYKKEKLHAYLRYGGKHQNYGILHLIETPYSRFGDDKFIVDDVAYDGIKYSIKTGFKFDQSKYYEFHLIK